jgi:hypothetical protein
MTIRLASTDLAACFDLFQASAFRLETLRVYDVPAEAESLRAFRLGQPMPERSPRTNPWLARIAQTTAAGKSWSRTRIVGRPLTAYERFQLGYGYPASAQAGEVIAIAGRASHPELAGIDRDYWLFDEDSDPFAAVMAYDERGAYLGSEVTADPAIIGRCRERKRLAERHAVPLDTFLGQYTA